MRGNKGKIQQLVKKQWLHQLGPSKQLYKDARLYLRKYFYSDIQPLIESIKKEIKLSSKKTSILKKLLDSEDFRSMIIYKKTCTTIQDIHTIIVKLIEGCQTSKIYVKKHLSKKHKKMKEKQWKKYYEKKKNPLKKVYKLMARHVQKNVEKYKITDTRVVLSKKDFMKYIGFILRLMFTDNTLLIKLKRLPHPSEIHDLTLIIPESLFEAIKEYQTTGKLE